MSCSKEYSNANGSANCWVRHPFNAVKRAECQQDYVDLEGMAVVQENMGGESNNWGQTPNVGGIPVNTTAPITNTVAQKEVDIHSETIKEDVKSDWSMIGYISLAVAVVLVGNYLIVKKSK